MNLKRMDFVIKQYAKTLNENDMARLEFFRKLWGVMDEHEKKLSQEFPPPTIQQLREAAENEVPFLQTSPVTLNGDELVATAIDLAEVIGSEESFAPQIRQEIVRVEWGKHLAPKNDTQNYPGPTGLLRLFADNLNADETLSDQVTNIAVLVLSMALRVQLQGPAQAIMDCLEEDDKKKFHPFNCPVCGSRPGLARIGGANVTQGRGRILFCQQCGTEWDFQRVRCPRCGTTNQNHLHYFNVEGDDTHRIHTCDECGDYIRTVFVENEYGLMDMDVEDVVTARLDAIANDSRFHAQE